MAPCSMELLNAKVGLSQPSSMFPSNSAMEIICPDRTPPAERGTSFPFGEQPNELGPVEWTQPSPRVVLEDGAKLIDLIR